MSPISRALLRAYTLGTLSAVVIVAAVHLGLLPMFAVAAAVTAVNAWLMVRTVRRAEAEVGR